MRAGRFCLSLLILAAVVVAFVVVDRWTFVQNSPTQPAPKAFAPVKDQTHLHNAHVVTSKVISGAQPEDEAAFKALQDLGIRTIISVDGARPDAELAHKYGMKYLHLPIGYDDVPEERGSQIAKAIAELPGPVYVHCHHGKHRVAAAVAVACVYNGSLKPEQAESVLKTFGTGANYIGLWKAARDARPVDPQALAALQVTFVEYTKINALAEHMVSVDERFDHLKQSQKAGWTVPADHPDIDPAHEALMLQEHFHEIGRMEEIATRPDDFRGWLIDSEVAGKELFEALRASRRNDRPANVGAANVETANVETANVTGPNAAFERLSNSCAACHKAYRD